jgi:hypothetical protein
VAVVPSYHVSVRRLQRTIAWGIVGTSALVAACALGLWTWSLAVPFRWSRTTITHGDVVRREIFEVCLLGGGVMYRHESNRFLLTPAELDEVHVIWRHGTPSTIGVDLPPGEVVGWSKMTPDEVGRAFKGLGGFLGILWDVLKSDPPTARPGPIESGRSVTRHFRSEQIDGRPYISILERSAFVVPWWLIVAVFAIAPGIVLRYTAKARRIARTGFCPRCGFDCRATRGRCPECNLDLSTES